jgi:hypothetical protein
MVPGADDRLRRATVGEELKRLVEGVAYDGEDEHPRQRTAPGCSPRSMLAASMRQDGPL